MKSFALTFDEKTFERDLTGNLEKLLQAGWNGFEFAPDSTLLPDNTYKQLISKLSTENAQASFHVPNFINGKIFNPGSFSTSLQLIHNFSTFFELCGWLTGYHKDISPQCPAIVVLHGAEYEHLNDFADMTDQTLKFLDWGANYCARQNLPLLLCLENAYSPNHLTIGDDFNDLQALLQRLSGYPLGFCADLPHLAGHSNTSLTQLIQTSHTSHNFLEEWLKQHLKHLHLHGYQQFPYKSHLPLHNAPTTKNTDLFSEDFKWLQSIGYKGLLVNEVLGLSEEEADLQLSHELSYLMQLKEPF